MKLSATVLTILAASMRHAFASKLDFGLKKKDESRRRLSENVRVDFSRRSCVLLLLTLPAHFF